MVGWKVFPHFKVHAPGKSNIIFIIIIAAFSPGCWTGKLSCEIHVIVRGQQQRKRGQHHLTGGYSFWFTRLGTIAPSHWRLQQFLCSFWFTTLGCDEIAWAPYSIVILWVCSITGILIWAHLWLMGFRTIGQYVLEGAKNSHFMGTLHGFIVGEVCTRGYVSTRKCGIIGW